ncbi:hypothetical protein [Vibrio crassostreae]|uniref:hypothetical protein n=1 Tax=Vibrio crassostreae TaxID=246167 RepID=UPI001B300762|nr:hypothetical protein [Vibrio crassostreae]
MIFQKNYSTTKFTMFLLIFAVAISWSQPFGYLTQIKGNVWFCFSLFFILARHLLFYSKVNVNSIFMVLIFFISTLSLGTFKESLIFLKSFSLILLSSLTFCLLKPSRQDCVYIFKYLTIFSYISLACSILSFVYAYMGGESSYSFPLLDGRISYFHIASFSNVWDGNIIRPGFIYDEPGAYSFFLCFVCFGRLLLNMDNKHSFFILFLGCITLSVMHFIVLVSFVLISLTSRQRGVAILLISSFLIFYFVSGQVFLDHLLDRFSLSSEAMFDNNRVKQVLSFITLVNEKPEVIYTGYDNLFGNEKMLWHTYGDMGASPITPILQFGLMGLIVQFFVFTMLLRSFFKKVWVKNEIFVSLLMCLMLLQRPFYLGAGYSLMVVMVIYMSCLSTDSNKAHTRN